MYVYSTSQQSTRKNGYIYNSNKNHLCHDYGRQFVRCFAQYLSAEEKRSLIEHLLLERISLRGICRAGGAKLKWLLGFLIQCVKALSDYLHVQPIICQHDGLIQRLEVEADRWPVSCRRKRISNGSSSP